MVIHYKMPSKGGTDIESPCSVMSASMYTKRRSSVNRSLALYQGLQLPFQRSMGSSNVDGGVGGRCSCSPPGDVRGN